MGTLPNFLSFPSFTPPKDTMNLIRGCLNSIALNHSLAINYCVSQIRTLVEGQC
uniref:Uncharacterized protein n=1 Tax=Rhizophora mucronata TaxID=61149 RepID=A0A2P2LA38_RHIMU